MASVGRENRVLKGHARATRGHFLSVWCLRHSEKKAEVETVNMSQTTATGKTKVSLRSVRNKELEPAVHDLLNSLGWEEVVFPDAKVVIKLNLNTAEADKVESANTSPALTEALIRVLQTRTRNITLVEAHAYRNSAEEAFQASGTYEVAERTGVDVVNLSKASARDVDNPLISPMPEILLDADVFITMPVIKTHALTYFTGSLKNQWGCVPRFDRIALHYGLDFLLADLHRILKPKLCIMDGIIGVEGRGPTNGDPRRLDIILGSRDGVALDATAQRLVGLEPTRCRHIVLAAEQKLGTIKEDEIELDSDLKPDWEPFVPAKMDWAIAGMNRMTKYKFFRKYILEVDPIFKAGKTVVNALRKVGIVR